MTATTIQVTFITNGHKTVQAAVNSNLLRVSLREQGGIPFKCGGGLCGTCKCKIEQGIAHTDEIKPKERNHLTEKRSTRVIAWPARPFCEGMLSVSWVPRPGAGRS